MLKNINMDKIGEKVLMGASIIMSGYLIGRFTAIKDLKDGNLNMFIPKDNK